MPLLDSVEFSPTSLLESMVGVDYPHVNRVVRCITMMNTMGFRPSMCLWAREAEELYIQGILGSPR